jgi:hypothetical protein
MNAALIFATGFILLTSPAFGQGSPRPADAVLELGARYDPPIDPADFTHVISNKYLTLKPGTRATYEKATPRGVMRVQIAVSGKTKKVMDVTTLVVRSREWLNDQLIEETREWVAQDKQGNVWQFGEAVNNYENGKLVDHDGSWKAGVDGAKPGILMLNDPKVGDTYRQQYRPASAEDMGTVAAVGKKLAVPQGPFFENCVEILDWNRVEADRDHKYYCVGLGMMVFAENGEERLKLVGFSTKYAPQDRAAREVFGSARVTAAASRRQARAGTP